MQRPLFMHERKCLSVTRQESQPYMQLPARTSNDALMKGDSLRVRCLARHGRQPRTARAARLLSTRHGHCPPSAVAVTRDRDR
jgi:hypothetical protein